MRAPPLRVFERLEVGPARVEPRRVVVPYRVHKGGQSVETELIYRYHEPVFEPWELADLNLASLIGAQVALNYSLFCDVIELHGPFGRADRRLLRDMAVNTETEILVHKFFEPNPFLTDELADWRPEGRQPGARLVFPDPVPRTISDPPWGGDPRRVALMSSGGKDSLLSLGLLEEVGCEVHPVFVTESGRHWYTALNAARHLEHTRPRTARVWTNSDRVFSWMLRQLPFIRRDFATIRADDYAIRLWTVAVFLFGVLPLLRRRGLGRLVLGDEFDCSQRVEEHGLVHHAGLYDQSRWFDQVLTDYFHRRGWGVAQFSIIRPLSELGIQKALIERYPELYAHQVSCHAAHLEGGRALPCGRCEKCRRIVGMVVALGGDPTVAGYPAARLDAILADLARRGVHQEEVGAVHLAHLLVQGGHIAPDTPFGRTGRECPEVMSLRFDPEHSPVTDVPADLRAPLYRILLHHLRGAVRRRGSGWVGWEVLSSPALSRPARRPPAGAGLRIDRVECFSVELALRKPYVVAYDEVERASVVFLRVVAGRHVGLGCVAPDPHVTGEDSPGTLRVLGEVAPATLRGADPLRPAALLARLQAPDRPAVRTAVDLALHDLVGKLCGQPTWRLLGGYRRSMITSVTLGIGEVDEVVREARELVAQGFVALKIKGGRVVEEDIERVVRIREAVGPGVALRFDANQGYTVDQAVHLVRGTVGAGLELLEQPTPGGRPQDLGRVRQRVSVPVMADESLLSVADAYRLARDEVVDMVNLKLVKVGGLDQALVANGVARAAGLGVMVGCMDEPALSISAGLALALARPNVAYADLDGHLDLVGDPTEGCVILRDGALHPSDRPGLGAPAGCLG